MEEEDRKSDSRINRDTGVRMQRYDKRESKIGANNRNDRRGTSTLYRGRDARKEAPAAISTMERVCYFDTNKRRMVRQYTKVRRRKMSMWKGENFLSPLASNKYRGSRRSVWKLHQRTERTSAAHSYQLVETFQRIREYGKMDGQWATATIQRRGNDNSRNEPSGPAWTWTNNENPEEAERMAMSWILRKSTNEE